MSSSSNESRLSIRDLGYAPGLLSPGPTNSILDVTGVHISQVTVPTSSNLRDGSTAAKGVTVLCPRPPEEFYKPCHASTFTFNGNGELTGSRQMRDWGFTNTPIAFTNSLSLGTVFDGMWDWVLDQQTAMGWDELSVARNYGTPVVGETADWMINSELKANRLSKADVAIAFANLKSKEDGAVVEEGQKGGGAGMTCHQFTGGTGTSSRIVGGGEGSEREYTLGVLCQSNYGVLQDLRIGGVPVGQILKKEKEAMTDKPVISPRSRPEDEGAAENDPVKTQNESAGRTKDGSVLIVIMTDAPLLPHQLDRLARHATVGLAQVGAYGIGRTFSGDIFLALSTADHPNEQLENAKLQHLSPTQTYNVEVVKNESIDSHFYACAEAVEEAVLNSLVGARNGTVTMDGTEVSGLPAERVRELLKQHLVRV